MNFKCIFKVSKQLSLRFAVSMPVKILRRRCLIYAIKFRSFPWSYILLTNGRVMCIGVLLLPNFLPNSTVTCFPYLSISLPPTQLFLFPAQIFSNIIPSLRLQRRLCISLMNFSPVQVNRRNFKKY